MSVNLTKPTKSAQSFTDDCRDLQNTDCVREYTPVHKLTEEESITKYCPAPTRAMSTPTIEVLPSTIEGEVALADNSNKSNPLSYTEYTRDQRLEHLIKNFRRPNTVEIQKLEKIREVLLPFFRKQQAYTKLFYIGLVLLFFGVAGVLVGLLGYLTTAFEVPSKECHPAFPLVGGIGAFLLAGGVSVCVSCLHKAPNSHGLNNEPVGGFHLEEVILDPTAEVFICDTGADTIPTEKSLKFRQRIASYIFRPYGCDDDSAFRTIVQDQHDVYLIYKDGKAVFVDPLLFE